MNGVHLQSFYPATGLLKLNLNMKQLIDYMEKDQPLLPQKKEIWMGFYIEHFKKDAYATK